MQQCTAVHSSPQQSPNPERTVACCRAKFGETGQWRRRRRPGRRGARASSQFDQRCDGAGHGEACRRPAPSLPILRVSREKFLYTLKAWAPSCWTGPAPAPLAAQEGRDRSKGSA